VKKNAIACEEVVAFAVIDRHPMRVNFCGRVRTARSEGSLLILRRWRVSEHFAARCIVETCCDAGFANRFQDADCTQTCNLAGVLGDVEADADMTLSAEVIDLCG